MRGVRILPALLLSLSLGACAAVDEGGSFVIGNSGDGGKFDDLSGVELDVQFSDDVINARAGDIIEGTYQIRATEAENTVSLVVPRIMIDADPGQALRVSIGDDAEPCLSRFCEPDVTDNKMLVSIGGRQLTYNSPDGERTFNYFDWVELDVQAARSAYRAGFNSAKNQPLPAVEELDMQIIPLSFPSGSVFSDNTASFSFTVVDVTIPVVAAELADEAEEPAPAPEEEPQQ